MKLIQKKLPSAALSARLRMLFPRKSWVKPVDLYFEPAFILVAWLRRLAHKIEQYVWDQKSKRR
jgi:hypothetical protein